MPYFTKPVVIATVHGINTSREEAEEFADCVSKVVERHDTPSEVRAIVWPSHDDLLKDLSVSTKTKTLKQWAECVRREYMAIQPDMFVCHSMGCVLTSYLRTHRPIIALGSPLGHSFYGPLYKLKGMNVRVTDGIDIWNEDDPVAAAQFYPFKRYSKLQDMGWQSVRIAAPKYDPLKEHSYVTYLDNLFVQRTILEKLDDVFITKNFNAGKGIQ